MSDDAKTYAIKSLPRSGVAYGEFQWPIEAGVYVTCRDWEPSPKCGHGLHAFKNGCGDGTLAYWGIDALWYLLSTDTTNFVDLDGQKCKAEKWFIERVGSLDSIIRELETRVPEAKYLPVMGAFRKVGDFEGVVTVGDFGTAISGRAGKSYSGKYASSTSSNSGESISLDFGRSESGDHGKSISGFCGTSISGHYGDAISKDYGTSISGYLGKSTSGHFGKSTSEDRGHSQSGTEGKSISGNFGKSISKRYGQSKTGNFGEAISGDYGKSQSGSFGKSTSGRFGKVRSGMNGTLAIEDCLTETIFVGKIDGVSLFPDTWYELIGGKFVMTNDNVQHPLDL